MKVLLCADIKKLGLLGDVIEVSDGFARNYLLPQNLAIVPTDANIKSLAKEKTKRAEERIQERKLMEKAAEKVEGAEAVIASKANEEGHLFGSVTAADIAKNLRDQGFEVADDVVHLQEHIKEVGARKVQLRFAEDLIATVNVVVVAQQDENISESAKQEN